MKNWGKCLHESQTNIWDVCVCAYVDDGGRGTKGGKVLPCLTQVQWSLPITNNLPCPWTTKKATKVYQLMKSQRNHFLKRYYCSVSISFKKNKAIC